ncbi:MAG: glucosaminidase domain-containing protein [Deltaproteobacteria bacterium]|nr:glucosaminidase domain-containing protein [Deltaproteobacteria bacterium]
MKINQKISFSGNGYLKADLTGRSQLFNRPGKVARSAPPVRPEYRIIAVSLVFGLCCLCLLLVLLARRPPASNLSGKKMTQKISRDALRAVRVDSSEDLLDNLRSRNLWDIGKDAPVSPVIFANLPQDMNSLDVETKKKAFINTLLPISLIALQEIEQEKKTLHSIMAKLDDGRDFLSFDHTTVWPRTVSEMEIEILERLTWKYRTNSKEDLLLRVEGLPLSLILAQGALESCWGSSRFAAEGNNLFGIWTWGEEGIIPASLEQGASHKVAMFDSLLDSLRAYLLMINRLPAYAELRQLRSRTGNSMSLADGLLNYSERRDSYIADVKQIIVTNELRKFDALELAENFQLPPEPQNVVSLRGAQYVKM